MSNPDAKVATKVKRIMWGIRRINIPSDWLGALLKIIVNQGSFFSSCVGAHYASYHSIMFLMQANITI
jgi:hypothetical protein